WNGLSELAALAAGSGLTVENRATLQWSEVGPSDVLFIVYPTTQVDAGRLTAFLRARGRALIADDYGRADEALLRLGLLRHPRAAPAASTHDGTPTLPVAAPMMAHALARGAGELVTNHPSTFSVSAGRDAVFGFGGGDVVVATGTLGDGTFVALSDPSVLIN